MGRIPMGWSTPLPDRATRKVSIAASLAIISTGAFARRGTRGVTPRFTDVGRSLWTGLSGGIAAALSALVVFAVVGVGIALSVFAGRRYRSSRCRDDPASLGQLRRAGPPGCPWCGRGALRECSSGGDHTRRRPCTRQGEHHPLLPIRVALVLPGTVALWTLFTLRRATPGGPLWRVLAVLAVVLGSVVTVAGAAVVDVESLRASRRSDVPGSPSRNRAT